MCSHTLNSKNYSPFSYLRQLLGIKEVETVPSVSSVGMDGLDEHGLKLEKVWPIFSNLTAISGRIIKNVNLWLVLPDEI